MLHRVDFAGSTEKGKEIDMAAKKAKKKVKSKQIPELEPAPDIEKMTDRLTDAIAHLKVAYDVSVNGPGGNETAVMLTGIQMAEEVEDWLEDLQHQLKKMDK